MSIATEISRLQTAKADIKTAIINKGVQVPNNALIDTYDTYIAQIQTGGGGQDTQLRDLIERDITSLTIPSGTTSVGDYALQNLTSLTSVSIPSSVATIGTMSFNGCTGLSSVTIANGLTTIGQYAFQNCSGITSITLPNSLTTISGQAFYNCSGLTSVTIPNSVTTIGNQAFSYCTSMTSVTIGSGVTSIGGSAFNNNGTRNLTTVTCLATTPPTMGTQVFAGNYALTTIYVPSASVNAYKAASGWSDYSSKIQAIPE